MRHRLAQRIPETPLDSAPIRMPLPRALLEERGRTSKAFSHRMPSYKINSKRRERESFQVSTGIDVNAANVAAGQQAARPKRISEC